ncbi:MAG: DNA recombination protein RmuC [Candidatus Heimdallarchaeota archaeon]
MDKLAIDKLNKNSIRRAKEIIKYTQSIETTDFVLMYIPDFVYGVLIDQTFQNLAKMNVIPTNTSGLLSTIFMIKMQHRFTKLNSAASSFGNIQMKVCQGIEEVLEKIKTGTGQLQNSLNNITVAKNELTKLNNMLNTLDIENF